MSIEAAVPVKIEVKAENPEEDINAETGITEKPSEAGGSAISEIPTDNVKMENNGDTSIDDDNTSGDCKDDDNNDDNNADDKKDTVKNNRDNRLNRDLSESSERFKIVMQGLPKYIGTKQLKKFLLRNNLGVRKACIIGDHAYVSFIDESNVVRALEILPTLKLKNRTLRVKRAAAHADPYYASKEKRRKIDNNRSVGATAEPTPTVDVRSESEKLAGLLAVVVPLYSLPYEEQLHQKQRENERQLKSISKQIIDSGYSQELPDCGFFGELRPVLSSPIVDGYRNKCEFTVGLDLRGQPRVGFRLARYRDGSAEIFPVDQCPHVPDETKKIVNAFQQLLSESPLPPFDVTTRLGFWSMLTVRQFRMDSLVTVTTYPQQLTEEQVDNAKTALVKLFFPTSNQDLSKFRVTSLYFQRLKNASDPPVYEYLAGAPYVYENLYQSRFRVSPGAFFQINTYVCEVLYRVVEEACSPDKETLLLDICCGTGTIGIVLAQKFAKVIGVELCAEAVEDARVNAAANGATNCEFICAKVEDTFETIRRGVCTEFSRVVGILDPPRSGVATKVLTSIRLLTQMRRVVYVACNPAGAAANFLGLTRRPSKRYPGDPFRLTYIQPVDMFPHTSHCEWVLVFERD